MAIHAWEDAYQLGMRRIMEEERMRAMSQAQAFGAMGLSNCTTKPEKSKDETKLLLLLEE